MRGRAKVVLDWLRGGSDTALGRLTLQWFRAYFEASRNSSCAVTVYSSLSVFPAALVAVAVLHPSKGDANVLAHHVVTHMHLTGATASLVEGSFGSASANALAASVTVAISFLLWGIGIGQIYQDVYARAWGIKVGSVSDQAMFAVFFFVLAGAIALWVVSAADLHAAGLAVLVPVWILASTAFWLLVPHFLLHRKIALGRLLPGALLSSIVIGGTVAAAPLFVAPPLNQNGKAFGAAGVVLTSIGYAFVVITMSLVCAVFSPVWIKWRETEKQLREDAEAPSAGEGLVAS